MRDVVLQQMVSLDGFSCADGSEFQQYIFGIDDPAFDRESQAATRPGTHVMGRVSYEAMAAYFPIATGLNVDVMNEVPKVVFSRTLERADWAPTTIARGELRDEIARLKSQPGEHILVHGGIRLAQSLVAADLVDEYRLFVFPVLLGRGDSIFASVTEFTRLELTSSRAYPSGVVTQTLRRCGESPGATATT